MGEDPANHAKNRARRWLPGTVVALLAVALLTVASYLMSFSAVRTKSATADEPLHLVAARMHVFDSDFRLDPEDPPLWSWLAMALVPRDAIRIDPSVPIDPAVTVKFIDRTLWFNSGTTALGALERARAGMALLAPALVVLCAWCAWKIAGPTAGVAAAAIVACDPLVLGHAPLVKNDVAITLATVALLASVVAVMRRITVARAILLVVCSAAVTVKFSGLLLVTLTLVTLLIQAIVRRSRRDVLISTGLITVCVLVCWGAIWLVYGFHFAPTRDPQARLEEQWFVRDYAQRQLLARLGRPATEEELNAWKPDASVRAIQFASARRLLPQAYLMGLMYTRGSSFGRHAYLLGELSASGRWYYFPLALLFKLPAATIAAMFGAVLIGLAYRRSIAENALMRPSVLAAAIIGGGYFAAAMISNMNIGVRHVMPAVIIAYVAVAVVFAEFCIAKPRWARVAGMMLVIALAIESIAAYPNYIAFFNAAVGGSRGGLALLSDSNLDWGQDLPLLADWQSKHPGAKLYLGYFGNVPPEAYGIDYVNLPGGYWTRPQQMPTTPGVLAISATRLQCIYLPPDIAPFYYDLRVNHQPREVLGGTIYLYGFPLKR
jgi:4-amino-4-deoxy-L-arabinose transferase-like glycosyltransferase